MKAYPTPKTAAPFLLLLFLFFGGAPAWAVVDCGSVSTFKKATDLSKRTEDCGKDCEKKVASMAGCDLSGAQAASEKVKQAVLQGSNDQKHSGVKSDAVATDGVKKTKGAKDANKKIDEWTKKKVSELKVRAYRRAQDSFTWASTGRGPPPLKKQPGAHRTKVAFATYMGTSSTGDELGEYVPKRGRLTSPAVHPTPKSGAPGRSGVPDNSGGSDVGSSDMSSSETGGSGGDSPSSISGGSATGGSGGGSSGAGPKGRFDALGKFIPDPVELAKAQADLRLAQRAERAASRNELFPRQEAQKAHDPALRQELLTISAAQELKQETKHEEVRLTHQLEELVEIAITSKKTVQGLGSLPAEAGGALPAPRAAEAAAKDAETKKPTEPEDAPSTLSGAADLASAEEISGAEGAPARTEKELSAIEESAPREMSGHQRESLRAKLSAYLKSKEGSAAGILDSAFDGKLERPNAVPGEDRAQGLGDVIGSAFTTAREASFSMRMSETEAEVNGFLSESQRELASSSAGGVLQPDSPGLFIRVNLAHRRCQEHRCVRANAN